jgi:serine/threonine-protein kinase
MAENHDDLHARAAARIGSWIRGKYHLDRLLGVGGMAVVYAATHRNGRTVAIKMLHPEMSLNKDTRTRFLREGHAANAVRHPGAVAVLDDDVADDGAAFLVMELLDGATVEEIWERHDCKLPLAAVLAVGVQLLEVLAAAHAHALVHRDIKPGNLFLTKAGEIKVLDFGIARLRDVTSTASSATKTGLMLGTPAFMAPEQAMASSAEVGPQSDLWSVGATLFSLASGQTVHQAENVQQLVVVAATRPARSFSTAKPNAPRAVVSIIDRALAFQRADRWPDALAMRDALVAAATEAFGAVMSSATLTQVAEQSVNDATEPMANVPSGPSGPALVSPTTAGPVSRDAFPRGARLRLPRAALLAGGGAIVAGCLVGAAVVYATRDRATSDDFSGASAAASVSSPPGPTGAVQPVPPVAMAASAPLVGADASVQEVSVDQLPAVATARPARGGPAPQASVIRPSARAASCNPPFTLDAQGTKHWKRECLE